MDKQESMGLHQAPVWYTVILSAPQYQVATKCLGKRSGNCLQRSRQGQSIAPNPMLRIVEHVLPDNWGKENIGDIQIICYGLTSKSATWKWVKFLGFSYTVMSAFCITCVMLINVHFETWVGQLNNFQDKFAQRLCQNLFLLECFLFTSKFFWTKLGNMLR